MKLIMFLGLIIGVLFGSLIYVTYRYIGDGVKNYHIKTIEKNTAEVIKVFCFNQIEYIIVTTNGTAITPALDANGKPLSCNF